MVTTTSSPPPPVGAPPIDALRAALDAADEAARACLAVAWEGESGARGYETASAYYKAEASADAALEAIIAAGGARGLDDALGAAHRRATERLTACYALRAGTDDPHADRAVLVAEHAAERALARLSRAQVIALAWIAKQQTRRVA